MWKHSLNSFQPLLFFRSQQIIYYLCVKLKKIFNMNYCYLLEWRFCAFCKNFAIIFMFPWLMPGNSGRGNSTSKETHNRQQATFLESQLKSQIFLHNVDVEVSFTLGQPVHFINKANFLNIPHNQLISMFYFCVHQIWVRNGT